jgi:hypothetical protein
MPQPNDLSRSLVALDQNGTIIAVVELSHSSFSLPPLECCFGTSPIQAAKFRADRNALGWATPAAKAVGQGRTNTHPMEPIIGLSCE